MPANPLRSLKRAARISSSMYLAESVLRDMAGNTRSFVLPISTDPESRYEFQKSGRRNLAQSRFTAQIFRSALKRYPYPVGALRIPYGRMARSKSLQTRQRVDIG